MTKRLKGEVLEFLEAEAHFVERQLGHVLFEEDVVDPGADVLNSSFFGLKRKRLEIDFLAVDLVESEPVTSFA